jgi:hypothetical protein
MATASSASTPTPKPVGAKPNSAPAAPKSKLGLVKRGQLRNPLRHLFYGPEGVGKSSLAADAPAPIFLDVEGGSDNIEAARYPFRPEDAATGHVPRAYEEVLAAIDDLIANPAHGYATLVIDTIDALEVLLQRYVCDQNGKADIEAFGFGKGYRAALDEWRRFLSRLDALRATGVQVVLLGHSYVKTFKNPEGEDFDRYVLRVHDLASGQIKEWSDVVGFIHFDGGAAKLKGDTAQTKRARGWTSGRRLVQLAREAAWDAKSRLSLPSELELGAENPWRPFAEAKEVAREATVEMMAARIATEVDRITEGSRDTPFLTAAGRATSWAAISDLIKSADPSVLTRVLAGLRATTAIIESKES